MSHRPVLLLSCLLVLLLGACSVRPDAASTPERQPTLILISLDGFRHDYLEQFEAPALESLAAGGVRAERLIPVFPTLTFPNHYSIVTGLHPERHGIVGNTMYDPAFRDTFRINDPAEVTDGRWWGGEPIWVTAERQGRRAAALFWPGSEAEIQRIRPSYWKPYDGGMPYDARVDTVLRWLDLPADRRPAFVTLYFSAVDSEGHDHGPAAPQTGRAVARVDSAVGRLAAGLEARGRLDDVNLLIVSDHGMAGMSAGRRVLLDEYMDVEAAAERVFWGATTSIWPRPGQEDSLYSALEQARIPHVRLYRREDTPERLHFRDNPRIAPILLLADEGWEVTTRARWARRRGEPVWGAHGFDNAYPSMHGLLLAHGPAFRRGATVPPVSSVDLYELMARVLRLLPARNDGDPAATEAMLR